MSYIKKPKIIRDSDPRNKLGMTFDDYEGVKEGDCLIIVTP